jgi:hypothetical protein
MDISFKCIFKEKKINKKDANMNFWKIGSNSYHSKVHNYVMVKTFKF